MADEKDREDAGYRYDEDAEGHENQLEFDRDYATYDALQKRGLLNPEMEERIREDLEGSRPDHTAKPAQETGRQAHPDADIERDALDRLKQHEETREVRVSVREGEITLEGTVEGRATKRLAEDLLETVPGMRDIHNRLTLRRGS